MKKLLTVAFSLLLTADLLTAQTPQISYVLPDVGTPGMNTYVEIVAPVGAVGAFGAESMSAPAAITIEFVNPADTGFIVVSPVVVGWEGRLISCQFFVKPYAPLRAYPFRVRVNANRSNVDTFLVQAPQAFGSKSGGGAIGSGGAWGKRSKRGAMIVDSLVLGPGLYTIDTQIDSDPSTPGHQGFLPAVILSKGPIRIGPGAVIDAGANGKNGGPGGGGGGGYGSGGRLVIIPIPGENNAPLGNGFAGGRSNITVAPSPAASFGLGTGSGSRSLNGVEANNGYQPNFPTIRGYAAAPGHPFDNDGRSGGASALVVGASTLSFGQYFGGGGNAQRGQGGFPASEEYLHGQVIGNREVVPLHGGSGGAGGGPNDSVGAGGGGGLALYSAERIVVSEVRANGANGSDGCANCSPVSGKAAGGGAGGCAIVGGKLGVQFNTISVAGGAAGRAQEPARSNGSVSGSGGAGRFRHDGRIASGAAIVTPGATHSTGPTMDTLTVVAKPIFTVGGTGEYRAGRGANVWVFVRGETLQWNYASPYTAVVRPDSTWQVEVAITTTDSLLYIFAVQLTDPAERLGTNEWTRIPTHVFSQAAANIVRYFPAPELTAPVSVNIDTAICSDVVLDTIVIRNTGAGTLIVRNVEYLGPFVTVSTPGTFPRNILPGGVDTIILRYDGRSAPYGGIGGELRITSNDASTGSDVRIIPVTAFKARITDYIEPDPDNPPAINFGDVRVNTSIDRRAVIRNLTAIISTDILVDSLWVSPPTVSIITISRSVPKETPIRPGDSLVVQIRYSPTEQETLGSVFLCARISQPCRDTICWPLTGRGVQSAVATSKPSLAMIIPDCSTRVETDDTLVISNLGNVSVDVLSIAASPAGTFDVLSPSVPPSLPLPPGASSEIIVRYTPGQASRAAGSLVIRTNDPVLDSLSLTIEGAWNMAAIEPWVRSVGLFSSCPGVTIDSVVRIYNRGSMDCAVTLEHAGGTGPFSISPVPMPYVIPSGDSIDVTLSFTPAIPGIITRTMYLRGEPCGLLDSLTVQGGLVNGDFYVEPQPLAFGDVRNGSTTQRVATVKNRGSIDLRILDANIVPPTPELTVALSEVFPLIIPANGEDYITLIYSPTSLGGLPPGTRLEVVIDSPCDTVIWTEVVGQSVEGTLLANPNPLDFGEVYSCLRETDTIRLRNVSAAALTILDVQVDPNPGEFTAALADPSMPTPQMDPDEEIEIVVTFGPVSPPDVPKSATLKIVTNDPGVGTFEVPLRGTRISESLTLAGPAFAPTFPMGTDVRRRTIINNGTAPFHVGNLTVNPPFRIVQVIPPTALLAPGQTMFVDLEFAPTAEGLYEDSIRIEGLTICGPVHLQVTGECVVASVADAYWEGITGKPGETILLPLMLASDVTGTGITQYDVDARYNASMLFPKRVVLNGTLSDDWVVTGFRRDSGAVSFRATGEEPLAGAGTLAFIEMLVLLGNDLTTTIESTDSSRFLNGGARLAIAPGTFALDGYCAVGSNRLVRVTNDFGIKLVAPNPAGDRIAVDFELVEDGPTSLALYDMIGRRVAVLLDAEMAARPHHLETFLDVPDGVYFLELTTRTQREQAGVVVGR